MLRSILDAVTDYQLQAAVPDIVQEFSRDFYIEEAAVWAVYQPPHQFNAIDTRSALKVDFWLAAPEPFDQEMLRTSPRTKEKSMTAFT